MARGYPDFEGNKRGMYSPAEWAAKEGDDKNFRVAGLNKTFAQIATAAYAVPAGKTLYIVGMAINSTAVNAADADNNHHVFGGISEGLTIKSQLGGNGGAGITFSKPHVIAGGTNFNYSVVSGANHNVNMALTAWGYEL